MKIVNKSQNIVLADNVIVADSLFARMKGLLGRREFRPGEAIVLNPCFSIHTFFMRFPIDVLFVDSHNKIVGFRSALPPWRITSVYWQAKYAIEFPCGTLSNKPIRKGDEITLLP